MVVEFHRPGDIRRPMREDEHLGSCVSLAILMERALLREIERTWRAYKWGFQQRQAARMRLPVWLALLMPPAKTHGRNPSRAREVKAVQQLFYWSAQGGARGTAHSRSMR